LHKGSADDILFAIVGTLYQNIGTQGSDNLFRRGFIKNGDVIDRLKAGQDNSSGLLRLNGPIRSLEGANAGITVEPDDEQVGLGSCLLQVLNVTRVQDVEAAVGKRNPLAQATPALSLVAQNRTLKLFLISGRPRP